MEEFLKSSSKSYFFGRLKSGISSSITSMSHKVVSEDNIQNISFDNLLISPLDPFETSTHICLCAYGILSGNSSEQQMEDQKYLNFLLKDKRNVDFYFYEWQNASNFYQGGSIKNALSSAL